MNDRDILRIALEQSAIDSACSPEAFMGSTNRVFVSTNDSRARRYLELPYSCDLVSYGSCVVASVSGELKAAISEYIGKYRPEECFETPQIHELQHRLSSFGQSIRFMAEYWLPNMKEIKPLSCDFELRFLCRDEFAGLYLPEWSNALCKKRAELDVLTIAAFDGSRMVGMAGCSMDCETMWQIGVDVLPKYRRMGIASAMTSRLALEVLGMDIVPFYCCAWANMGSARNAIRSGFRPAWAQLTAKGDASKR